MTPMDFNSGEKKEKSYWFDEDEQYGSIGTTSPNESQGSPLVLVPSASNFHEYFSTLFSKDSKMDAALDDQDWDGESGK